MIKVAAEDDGEVEMSPGVCIRESSPRRELPRCGSRPRNRLGRAGRRAASARRIPNLDPNCGIAADSGTESNRHHGDRNRGGGAVPPDLRFPKSSSKARSPQADGPRHHKLVRPSLMILASSTSHDRRNHPSVVLMRTRHGDHAKRKHPAQIIHSLIVTARTDGSIERREVPQDLHHGFHRVN